MDAEDGSSGFGGGGDARRRKLVYFQNKSSPPDHVYEEQNSLPKEDILRTSSHACCPNQTPPPVPSPFALNKSITLQELGADLAQLQARVLELEYKVVDRDDLPALISDLKSQVENLRNKLEAVEIATRKISDGYRRASDAHFSAVHVRFSQIWNHEVSDEVKRSLLDPSFDTNAYDDAEMLLFLQYMFQHLKLLEPYQISIDVLRKFLYEVYKNYNQVPFHNFRHCFCVAQMMFAMICQVDLLNSMGPLDTLILLVSCICHDLDHPGYNNIYQINARTELALRYNDISPLENHHCSVAFRILENPQANIFATLDKETFKEVREGIIRCILATDMARHNEILSQFKEVISDFDFANRTHRNLLAMVLIKVADISNEARPMPVAEPWLDKLLTEFFQQSDLEKLEGLPVTPFMDREKITKPSSQCSFIGFVLLPLFEALGELLPPLQELIIEPARAALEHYRKLNDAAKDERMRRKSVIENGEEVGESGMVKSSSGLSRRSVANSSVQSRQRSRSSADGSDASPPMSPCPISCAVSLSLGDDEDEETATEVEVAEKAVKFKISTETATPGRSTCPNSRKGSRERSQLELEDARRKSLAVLERGNRAVEASAPRRRSTSRVADVDVEVEDKPSLLAKLRSLKDKLPWAADKDEEEPSRSRTLPKRRSGQRRKSRGWRSWLSKAESRSSSLDALPHTYHSN